MLQAINPEEDLYDYRRNLKKRSHLIQDQTFEALPVIKTFKDRMIATNDVKTCIAFNNMNNRSINETTMLINQFKKNPSMTSNNNMITNNSNKINSKRFFNNKKVKLKSIPRPLIKSNSSLNINPINPNRTLNVLYLPRKENNNRHLKHSSSLPKLNVINKEYFLNNKCNYLVLEYTGKDNSKNDIKNKKYLPINPHKVINNLKNYSVPNDMYGKKLIDVIEERINSGFYQNYKSDLNLNNKYQDSKINLKDKLHSGKLEVIKEEQKFDGDFLKDIYDKFLLPGPDNKYNFTVHKIFLSQILEKICKKMVEIRDKNNKIITKEEIRKEFSNEVDNLRYSLLTGKELEIINNIYNINNNLNIISIKLGQNPNMNEMSIIDESQEKTDLINNNNLTSLEQNDKDKQTISSNFFKGFNNTINVEQDRKDYINIVESNFKLIHKEDNSKLLNFIKDTIQIPNKSLSIHDSFQNLYFNRKKSAKDKNINQSSEEFGERKSKKNSVSTSTKYLRQEEELNNVEKFILNTKKLRYTLNIKENDEEKEKERNLSYDSEGNIQNYFDVGLKLNPVFF